MTNQQILRRAIQKAIKGGWAMTPAADKYLPRRPGYYWNPHSGYGFIFNHDFAKALWGTVWPKKPIVEYSPDYFKGRIYWKDMLMEMVVADDPIRFLGDHV